MAPQFFEADVWAGSRRFDDQTLMLVIDWESANAPFVRAQLNGQIAAVAEANRAVVRDLREYSLRAFRISDRGERDSDRPVWTWRYLPSADEMQRDGWWRL